MRDFLNQFSGPLSALSNKAITIGVSAFLGWALQSGYIEAGDVPSLTAALTLVLLTILSAATRTQTAKIQDVNSADNGVKVVPADVPVMAVNEPQRLNGVGH